MKVHAHAYNNESHLFILEVSDRARGQWGGYVKHRLIETDNDTADRIGNGELKRFTDQDGLKVLSEKEGNANSQGPRSAYGKSLDALSQKFDAKVESDVMRIGLDTSSGPIEGRHVPKQWHDVKLIRDANIIADAVKSDMVENRVLDKPVSAYTELYGDAIDVESIGQSTPERKRKM